MRTALRIIGIQLLVAIAAAILTFWLSDLRSAASAGVGGLIAAASTAAFALRVFAPSQGAPLRKVVRAFYAGEVLKLLLTAAMFYAVIKWVDVAYLPLFLSYATALLVYWIVLPFSPAEPS